MLLSFHNVFYVLSFSLFFNLALHNMDNFIILKKGYRGTIFYSVNLVSLGTLYLKVPKILV